MDGPTLHLPELPVELDLSAARDWLHRVDDQLNHAFNEGAEIESLVHSRADGLDRLIIGLWQREMPADLRNELTLAAVGGYGRGELHPHSDIDLLVIHQLADVEQLREPLSDFLTSLWDLKLDVGHSVRSPEQCRVDADEDVTVATNLMEARLLDGSETLFEAMAENVAPPATWPGRDYFEAKHAEQVARHHRFDDTVYNLEPNVKEGLGGLRDIQMVGWVAKRHYGADSLEALVEVGFLEPGELASLIEGQRRLWRVRWALHRLADRREDRLLFDHQRDLAAALGYQATGDDLPVEQFMQDYFRTVMHLERLNERLLQAFEESLVPDSAAEERLDDHFRIQGGYLQAGDESLFEREPPSILTLFRWLQRRPGIRGVRAATIRQLRRSLDQIDEGFRTDPANRACFMAIIRDGKNLPQLLSLMHRYGVLGRYLPVFGRIEGRMQYDLFHVYTVDQHTLFVVRNLHRFQSPEDADDYPMVREIHRRLPKPELLYLAGFFHDIAKGRGGDHSTLGEIDAEAFCVDHDLTAADTNLVKWLVRRHLVMSVTAQRQDISDPDVVNRFAREVGNLVYLDYLYLLTVADISATSPKLWNSWKATLLADLYRLARQAIQRGLENPARRSEWVADTRESARQGLLEQGMDESAMQAIWAGLPDEYFLRHSVDQVQWQTGEMVRFDGAEAHVAIRRETARGTTEIFVYAPNLDGTFATILATLGEADLNIVDARAFNTTDHRVVDTFQVMDRQDRAVDSDERAERIRQSLLDHLNRRPLEPPPVLRPLPRRLSHFVRRPEINFTSSGEDGRTIMELNCSDRPGLLAMVSRVLLTHGVRIHGARIATFGERVEDYFLLSDMDDAPLGDAVQQTLVRDLTEELSAGMPDAVDEPANDGESP